MITAHFPKHDPVSSPRHYTQHKVECIEVTENMSFTLGNVIKYVWRADLKNGIQDLEKAKWYLEREIERRSESIEQAPAPELTGAAAALAERVDSQEAE